MTFSRPRMCEEKQPGPRKQTRHKKTTKRAVWMGGQSTVGLPAIYEGAPKTESRDPQDTPFSCLPPTNPIAYWVQTASGEGYQSRNPQRPPTRSDSLSSAVLSPHASCSPWVGSHASVDPHVDRRNARERPKGFRRVCRRPGSSRRRTKAQPWLPVGRTWGEAKGSGRGGALSCHFLGTPPRVPFTRV